MKSLVTGAIHRIAGEIGFDLVGVANAPFPSDPLLKEATDRYRAWLDHSASMDYLRKHADLKSDPRMLFPEVKSVICVGRTYLNDRTLRVDTQSRAQVSSYTACRDYHLVFEELLGKFSEILSRDYQIKSFHFVDSRPVLERFWGWRAGLGWIGKNSMLIHRKKGSYFFLGGLFVDIDLDADVSDTDHCGKCSKCIDACPTAAILPNRQIASDQCIAYHTIENRGEIPNPIMEKMGTWVAGCDICQQVCPWNAPKGAWGNALKDTEESAAGARDEAEGSDAPTNPAFGASLTTLATWTYDDFNDLSEFAMSRMKYSGFLRNLIIAISNSELSDRDKQLSYTQIESHMSTLPNEKENMIRRTLHWARRGCDPQS